MAVVGWIWHIRTDLPICCGWLWWKGCVEEKSRDTREKSHAHWKPWESGGLLWRAPEVPWGDMISQLLLISRGWGLSSTPALCQVFVKLSSAGRSGLGKALLALPTHPPCPSCPKSPSTSHSTSHSTSLPTDIASCLLCVTMSIFPLMEAGVEWQEVPR